ncbi:MAG: TetR/AcrR family transcriptional regulator [Myxococcota bacterium]
MKARRIPTQERSRRRYEGILDAAAGLFAETGFDATTMDAIAKRAGTSIGSVYQFFKNKKAIFVAVADRLMAREAAVFEDAVAAKLGGPWRDLLDGVVDAFVELREEPAWRAVWLTNLSLYGEIAELGDRYHHRILSRTEAIVGHYAKHFSEARRHLIAATMVEAIGSMLMASLRYDEATSRAMLIETKRMVQLYAEHALAESPAQAT